MAVTRFLTSAPKITPSNDYFPVPNLRVQVDDLNIANAGEDRFMDPGNGMLLEQLLRENVAVEQSQSKALPIEFIVKFCHNVFIHDYENVDFGQALTCLDYLSNLESTRRTVLKRAAGFFAITSDTWRDVLASNPTAHEWVQRMQKEELELEALYATVYVDIRLWVYMTRIIC